MSDVQDPTLEGQGAEGALETGQPSAFFEYEYPEKDESGNFRKEVFKSPEELKKAWRESYLRQSDYTRKTQDLANMRKELEKHRGGLEDQLKAFNERKSRYDKWDEALGKRPDIQRQLEQMAKSAATPDIAYERATGYVDEKSQEILERLEALEGRGKQQEEERELLGIFEAMEGKHEDFDRTEVRELLEYLSDGRSEPLVEMLHWASKGRKTPAELEQKMLRAQQQKRAAGLTPAGGAAPPRSTNTPKTTEEAKEMVLRQQGLLKE